MTRRCPLRERILKLLVAGVVVATVLTFPSIRAAAPPAPSKIAVIVMENHGYGQIIGNPHAPYINSLATADALATHYYAIRHPSLPNYLSILGGSTFGITNDCSRCHVNKPNLVDGLETAGASWRAYMEGLPSACFKGTQFGKYVKRHDPFMYFDDIRTNPARCANIVPYSDIDTNNLPDFTWITPNLCHDMHDCNVAAGDTFLSQQVPALLTGLGAGGILFLTWDEGNTNANVGGRVVTIAAGQGAKTTTLDPTAYNHYSLLRTIEDHFGLATLTAHDAGATPMSAMLQ